MKLVLSFFSLFLFSIGFSQYSDTSTCISGLDTLSYVVNYNQQQCSGSCDGSYSIQVLIGAGSYSYSVSGNLGYSSTLPSDTSLCPENMTCIVNDLSTGISCTSYFSIDTLQSITSSITTTNETVSGMCDGTANLTISDGIAPYMVTWYDSGVTPIPGEVASFIDSLCPATYYYSIDDAAVGCCDTCGGTGGTGGGGTAVTAFTINPGLSLTGSTTHNTCPNSCAFGFGLGSVMLIASGGTPPYTYSVTGIGTSNSSGFFNVCTSGIGTVVDVLGNTATFEYFIGDVYSNLNYVHDEICLNGCDGEIGVEVQTSPPFEYTIDGGLTYQSSGVFSNLCAGNYHVQSTNSAGCSLDFGMITIAPGNTPVINGTITVSPTSASGLSDGCVTSVVATGGLGSYTYTIDGSPISSFPACGLSVGGHEVCVLDANNCSVCDSVYILQALSLLVDTLIHETCPSSCTINPNNIGSVQLSSSGGVGPVVFTVDGTSNSTGYFDLCPGTYSALVTDNVGNTSNVSITVQEFISVMNYVNHEICAGSCDGEISLTGASPYPITILYTIDGGLTQDSSVFSNLCPGSHQVSMYTTNTPYCYFDMGIFVVSPGQSPIISTTTISPTSSIGASDGCVTNIVATGGVGAYSYSIDGSSFSSLPICGLTEGSYEVCVLDSNNCRSCDTVLIFTSMGARMTSITDECDTNCNASIVLRSIGGLVPITATIENIVSSGIVNATFFTDSTFSFPNLCSGIYETKLMDSYGTVIIDTITINSPSVSTGVLSDFNGFGTSCSTSNNGEAFVSYELTDSSTYSGTLWSNSEVTDTIFNLSSGSYVVEVSYIGMDSLMQSMTCVMTDTVMISSPDTLLATISNANSPTASATNCIGQISSNVVGGIGVTTYSWVDCNTNLEVSTAVDLINLCPGDYLLNIVDENTCSYSTSCETIQDVTGLDEMIQINWNVYPNPINHEFTIDSQIDGAYTISILDVTGKLVLKEKHELKSVTYNVQELDMKSGVYFIELLVNDVKERKRIVVE